MEDRNISYEPGTKYRHFKGDIYSIVAVGTIEKTTDKVIVYEDANHNVYSRLEYEFAGRVNREQHPDATQEFRFEPLEPRE